MLATNIIFKMVSQKLSMFRFAIFKKVLDILLELKHLHPIVLYKFFIVFVFAVIVILRYLFKMDDLHYQFPNQDVVVPEPDEVFFVCSLHVLKHC